MSKESALKYATGNPAAVPNPSLINNNPPPAAAATTEPAAGATATDTTPPAAAAQTDDQSKLSIIVKKEAEIFKQREAIKKEREEMLKTKGDYDKVINRIKEFEETAKKDKVAALKMLGWSDTDIINVMNNEPAEPNPIEEARKIAQAEAQKLRDELAQEKVKMAQDRDASLVSNFKSDISNTIKEQASKFKFAAHEGKEAELQAYHIIVENLKATKTPENPNGEFMSIEEALEITNDLYKQKYESGRKLFDPEPTAEAAPAATDSHRGQMAGKPPVSSTPASKPRTLTNAVTATSTSTVQTARETPSQKRERLIKAIQEQGLKKS